MENTTESIHLAEAFRSQLNGEKKIINVIFIRHAQSVFDLNPRFGGELFKMQELTKLGKIQAEQLTQSFCTLGFRFSHIYSSPQSAPHATAAAIFQNNSDVSNCMLTILEDLQENVHDNLESCKKRAEKGVDRCVLSHLGEHGSSIAVVSHQGTINEIVKELSYLSQPSEWNESWTDNNPTSWTQVEISVTKPHLAMFQRVPYENFRMDFKQINRDYHLVGLELRLKADEEAAEILKELGDGNSVSIQRSKSRFSRAMSDTVLVLEKFRSKSRSTRFQKLSTFSSILDFKKQK